MTGILTSTTATSGRNRSTASHRRWPSRAVATTRRSASASNRLFSPASTTAWSSPRTIRTRPAGSVSPALPAWPVPLAWAVLSAIERHPGDDAGPLAGSAVDPQGAADQRHPVAHAAEPDVLLPLGGSLPGQGRRREAPALVAHLEDDERALAVQTHQVAVGPRVAVGVGQRLLAGPVERDLDRRRNVARAIHQAQLDAVAGGGLELHDLALDQLRHLLLQEVGGAEGGEEAAGLAQRARQRPGDLLQVAVPFLIGDRLPAPPAPLHQGHLGGGGKELLDGAVVEVQDDAAQLFLGDGQEAPRGLLPR